VQLPDGQDRSAQINGARVVPLLSAALCLTSVGPPPIVLFSLPPFPCCRVSSTHLSSVVLVALLSPTIHSFPAACPAPFPHPFLTQRRVRFPVFSPSTWMSSAMVHPLSPSLSSPSLLATPSTRPPPDAITPTMHHVLRAGPYVRLSRYPVIPGGSARSHPDPEVLSCLGHYQSQEAVMEAVEGG
jgi:hypothetical protein